MRNEVAERKPLSVSPEETVISVPKKTVLDITYRFRRYTGAFFV